MPNLNFLLRKMAATAVSLGVGLGIAVPVEAANVNAGAWNRETWSYHIDFDEAGLEAGDAANRFNFLYAGLENVQHRLNISLVNPNKIKGGNELQKLMIFDSACDGAGTISQAARKCSGGDDDLFTGPGSHSESNQKNVLIVSEDNDSSDPDDDARPVTIRFKFQQKQNGTWQKIGQRLRSIGLIDVNTSNDSYVQLFDINSNQVDKVFIPKGGESEVQVLDFRTLAQQRNKDYEVAYFDVHLKESAAITGVEFVPEPLTILGSVAALGVGYGLRRKQNASQTDDC